MQDGVDATMDDDAESATSELLTASLADTTKTNDTTLTNTKNGDVTLTNGDGMT